LAAASPAVVLAVAPAAEDDRERGANGEYGLPCCACVASSSTAQKVIKIVDF
jgi:hypothetical protein